MKEEGFRLGVHVLRPVSRDEAAQLARAGVTPAVVHLPWRWTEKVRGQLDLSSVEHFLAPLQEAGVPLLGVLGPGMPHLLPDWLLKQGGVDCADYAERFTEHCGQLAAALPLTAFRVEDELNAAWPWEAVRTRRRRGRGWRDPRLRSAILARATAAVRQARPDATIQVTARTGVPGWRREVARWTRAGAQFDELGLALLPSAWLPDPELAEAVGDAVEAGLALCPRVVVSRTGYATASARFTPRGQREYLEHAVAAADRAGAAGLQWWALRDQAHDDPLLGYWTPSRERHMGLLYYDGLPKAAMDAFRVLATGARFGEG